MKQSPTFRLAAVFAAPLLLSSFVRADVVRASSFGYDPADATACLQAALDSDEPEILIDRQTGGWNVRPLRLNRGNLTLVLERGVTITAKAGAFVNGHDTLLSIEGGAHDVVIRGEGGSGFAMRKADYADRSRYAFSTHRHALALRHCRNVTLRSLVISDAGGDDIYVYHPTNTLIEDVVCRGAYRDAMSVISADRLVVRGCRFTGTSGTAPKCGVDVEANNPNDFIREALFENCRFDHNDASGFCIHLPGLDSTTRPVSITVRDCEMTDNRVDGIVTFAARPENPVAGDIRFENCRVRGNGRSALHMTNQEARGIAFAFQGCEFDGRGGATAAVAFGNTQIAEDFAGVSFDSVSVYADTADGVCSYTGMCGTGITGVEGVWTVHGTAATGAFDTTTLKTRYPSDPETRRFAAAVLDLSALHPLSVEPLTEAVTYPFIRNRFTFIQYVPGAGTYPIRFRLRSLDPAQKPRMTVQVRDRPGTDLGSFTTEELSHVYEIKAESSRPNIYVFEVSFGLGTLASVESVYPGQGILFNDIVNLFQFTDAGYYFAVPAAATEVAAELKPEEEMGATLEDGAGKTVDTQPYSRSGRVLRSVRTPGDADETWCVRFSRVREDGFFRLGAPAVPIATTDPRAVLFAGASMTPLAPRPKLTGKEWLKGTTDKDSTRYQVNEPMVFTVTVENTEGLPDDLTGEWRRTGDDGVVEEGTWNPGEALVYTTRVSRAGFVRLEARVKDGSGAEKMLFDGGAGAAIDTLATDKPTPADFETFWTAQKAALAAVPMTADLKEWPSPNPEAKVYSVTVASAGAQPSTMYLSVPVAAGTYPALVHFFGYEGSWSYAGTRPPKTVVADKLECWVTAHGFELGREEEYYTAFKAAVETNGYTHAFDPAENARPETAYFRGMSWRVMRAMEYVKGRPEWNGTELVVEGGSQGGMQSVWAAALVPGVTKADIYIPWNCNVGGTAEGRNHGDWYVTYAPGLDYYDTVNLGRLIPATCTVIISRAGLGDYISPPSGVAMFYNALTCPKRCLWLQGSQHSTLPPEREYSFWSLGL